MNEASQWRNVFLIPAIIGLICSFVALISSRETDAFIESRLNWLRLTEEERGKIVADKRAEASQGGLGNAIRFAFSHKQLKWLYITSAFVNMGFLLTLDYQVIMTYGYADYFLKGKTMHSEALY